MRLLGLTNLYPPLGYGYGAICRDVMEELQRRGHDSRVLCAEGSDDGPVRVIQGLGHIPAAWRKPIAGLRGELGSQRLTRAALRDGVDAALVWHMRGIGKGSLTLLHRAGVPVIYMLGDLWVIYERPGPPSLWRMWMTLDHFAPYRLARQAAAGLGGAIGLELRAPPIASDGTVCFASQWLRDRYAQLGFRPHDSHVVPNGIRIEDFQPHEDTSSRQLNVAFAGRLDPPKGADLAVAAVARLKGVRLVLAGGGEAASIIAIKQQIERLEVSERVRMIGLIRREDIASLLRRSDVFVMPAREPDAFGLVYIEAMAAGAAVIGTAKGGAAEICRDGENCLVVPDDEPAALIEALRRLRDDEPLRQRLQAAGYETAARYDIGAMVDHVERILSRATGQKS